MITIIDLTRMLAGPFATQILGDLNYRIIKVEEMRIGDATRHHPPYNKGVSAYFFSANRNKESVILDLKHPDGRKVLLDLVRGADAVIENFRPDVMKNLGLSYEELKAVNPGIVLVSITGFGSYGPLRNNVSFDIVAQAMSGAMAVTTPDEGEPIKPALSLGDLGAAMYGTTALLSGLLSKKSTGVGGHFEVGLLDAMLAMSSRVGEEYLLTGKADEPPAGLFPNGVFATWDGFLSIAAYTDAAWQALCTTIGRPDWIPDPRLGDAAARWARRGELEAGLSQALATRATADWLKAFTAAAVPAVAVADLKKVMHDPALISGAMVMTIDHPVAGPIYVVGNPIKRHGRPFRHENLPAPRHGEHTRRVLSAHLGYSEAEVERLIACGAASDLRPEPEG